MNKTEVMEELKTMLCKITGREELVLSKEASIFQSGNQLNPRDIVYLFFMMEEKYDIVFREEMINNYEFFTIENIAGAILREKENGV